MNGEKLFGIFVSIALGLYFIIARKSITYNALMRNVFKPDYDEKRLNIFEKICMIFGVVSVLSGILIFIYG